MSKENMFIRRVSKDLPGVVPDQDYIPLGNTLEEIEDEVKELNAKFGDRFTYTLERGDK